MPNRLATETSPYLLQHAGNPVDWYPWGPDAFEKARAEDKPVLLSIGYAACHWCHVMAHESFEDEATARLMNEHFVNIKVDREERPDVDGIYMQAVQAMTGHGGWPMTMFITPDGKPFYGGTYFPPQDRQGMPSFKTILLAVADAYKNKRDQIEQTASQLQEIYTAVGEQAASRGEITSQLTELAYRTLSQKYDDRHGGFGGAPKFPPTMVMDFLLRYWKRTNTEPALTMARDTFINMARGGIYDQIGGGFARYSVDDHWLVPHFEKMLYDNALLIRFGALLYEATKLDEVRQVTEETVEWLAREMTSPEGGFYSSLDADSEGHEGKFYVWAINELRAVLGDKAQHVITYYGVTPQGNFEGKNILYMPSEIDVAALRTNVSVEEMRKTIQEAKRMLYDVRAKRVWPGRDDKIIASWNGLMLRGVATAARMSGHEDIAIKNAEFLYKNLVSNGRVLRVYKSKIPGFLEDYAAIALGFLSVYDLTRDVVWVARAYEIAQSMLKYFWDDKAGVFYDTASDSEKLITRPREVTDNAIPSGNSLAVELLLHLSELLDEESFYKKAVRVTESLAEPMSKYPIALGHLLGVAEMLVLGASSKFVCYGDVCEVPSPELIALRSSVKVQA